MYKMVKWFAGYFKGVSNWLGPDNRLISDARKADFEVLKNSSSLNCVLIYITRKTTSISSEAIRNHKIFRKKR